MARPYRIPDFRKMYPGASEEVIAVLRTTERKMLYQEYDLKTEQTVIDEENQTVIVIPSREDSYERLMEASVQFAGEAPSTEEQVLRRIETEQLHFVQAVKDGRADTLLIVNRNSLSHSDMQIAQFQVMTAEYELEVFTSMEGKIHFY